MSSESIVALAGEFCGVGPVAPPPPPPQIQRDGARLPGGTRGAFDFRAAQSGSRFGPRGYGVGGVGGHGLLRAVWSGGCGCGLPMSYIFGRDHSKLIGDIFVSLRVLLCRSLGLDRGRCSGRPNCRSFDVGAGAVRRRPRSAADTVRGERDEWCRLIGTGKFRNRFSPAKPAGRGGLRSARGARA